jgi:phospholipid-transporting ATPase
VVTRPKTAVKTDPELMDLLKDGCGAKADRDFFLALATCNTIVPIVTDDAGERLVEYQGESPDEQALVYAAAAYGHTLLERTSGHIIIDVFGDRQRCVRTRHFTLVPVHFNACCAFQLVRDCITACLRYRSYGNC